MIPPYKTKDCVIGVDYGYDDRTTYVIGQWINGILYVMACGVTANDN